MTQCEVEAGMDEKDHLICLDRIVNENLAKGYAMDVRFEDRIRRVDELGKRALDIISAI